MAINVIKRTPQESRPSNAQNFGEMFSKGAQMLIDHKMKQDQQRAEQLRRHQEDQTLSELTGMDFSGIQDPKIREQAFKLAGEQKLLSQQQGFKSGQAKEKQDFLGGLFGGGKTNQSPQQNQQENAGQSEMGDQGLGFDASRLTDEDIARATSVDPNLGRALGHAKDVALREKRSEREFELQKQKASPDYQRQQKLESAQASTDVKYNQELQSAAKQHEIKTQTLNKLEALNKKGVTGKAYEKVLEKFGLVALTSDGRREFAADVKNLITDIRSILGGQFSTFEFQTILNAYPSADFSKGANEAIIKNLQEFQDIRNKEFEIAKEIKKENKGKVPFDFQSLVNEKLDQYAQSRLPEIKENTRKIMSEEYGIPEGRVLMFDPNGEPLNVSPQEVDHYIELGASLP